VVLASGGHPPAWHLMPGPGYPGPAGRAARRHADRVFADPEFVTSTLCLAGGSDLLLYTDGLTEARAADGELLGQDGLAAFLAGRGTADR
jgi:sigma-B regulation protein RsbU (phosphoserine phosphatase)